MRTISKEDKSRKKAIADNPVVSLKQSTNTTDWDNLSVSYQVKTV